MAALRIGPCGHRQRHARADPPGGRAPARHRRLTSGPPSGRLADHARADSDATGQAAKPGLQFHRPESRRPEILRRPWRDVFPRHQIADAGRYTVSGRGGARSQRCRDGSRAGQDVRRAGQRRPHRPQEVPVQGVGARADRASTDQMAGRKHGGTHAFSSRLSRITGSRTAHRVRSCRAGRNARMGRPRIRQRVRFRTQPAVDAVAVRHGFVRRLGRSAAQCHRGRPSPGPARRCLRSARPTPNPLGDERASPVRQRRWVVSLQA